VKGSFFCSAPEKNRDRARRDQNRLTLGRMKAIVTGATGMVGEAVLLPGMPLKDVAVAMINAVRYGAPKQVLEVPDIRELAKRQA
jgi:hypothetical protein